MRTKRALIIGGGIAGPVAALALRRAGIDSIVYESRSAPASGSGGAPTTRRCWSSPTCWLG